MFSFSSSSKNRGSKSVMNPRRPRPRLDRRNAAKNIDYDADGTASFSGGGASSPETLRFTRSLDLSPSYSNQTSFRIGGSIEGEVDLICQSLGLSGPEEFAISAAAWEASRERRSSSDLLPRSRLSPASRDSSEEAAEARDPAARVCEDGGIEISRPSTEAVVQNSRDGGIKGVRPPTLTPPDTVLITARSAPPTMSRSELNPSPSSVLAPPPSISMPELEKVGSTWDLVRSFAPEDDDEEGVERRRFYESEGDEEEVRERLRAETSEDVTTSTSNDDDSSSTATDISPIGRFKRTIKDWIKGGMLGSGSFGTVYEGINGDGFFFAVKEVSLLGHGSDAQQCILQLEQEIALLSQFEHENVVQYYGTEKDPEKLFIFLELVTQGSLVSLYQKYHLRDSQVSAYTRQILKGLNYLHERNVVHRDIKCANILVHASGSVKLADFGLAKQITKINMLKSCKGSVYWMAPEVVKPRQPYGPAADIWSLGCTVLEMLTRQVPYPNMEWIHVLYKVGKGEKPPIPPHISTDARDFITQCVQVNPSDRPSASQLLEHPFVRRSLPILGSGPDYSSSPSNNR